MDIVTLWSMINSQLAIIKFEALKMWGFEGVKYSTAHPHSRPACRRQAPQRRGALVHPRKI